MKNGEELVTKQKQEQILKLVTHSFYKELMNYGVDASDIVTVSVNLLDHITNSDQYIAGNIEYFNTIFKLENVNDAWKEKKELSFNGVTIKPLAEEQIPQVKIWLDSPEIAHTFIGLFPKNPDLLIDHMIRQKDHQYFAIFYERVNFVGVIGAEKVESNAKKLEMKKFIGNLNFRGKGIGKKATFLFLYYVFMILNFNKVYIYSIDTNITNINLNSKFGFGLEGILYEEVYLNGQFMDVLRMSLLKETWLDIFGN